MTLEWEGIASAILQPVRAERDDGPAPDGHERRHLPARGRPGVARQLGRRERAAARRDRGGAPGARQACFFVLRTSASILALNCALIVFKLPRALTKKPSEGYVYVAQCSLQPVQATQRAM